MARTRRNSMLWSLFTGVFLVSVVLIMTMTLKTSQPAAASIDQPKTTVHTLDLLGQIGGGFKAIAINETTVYAAIGPRLAVLDASAGIRPLLVGQTAVLPFDIQSLAFNADHVYAAAGMDGLQVFDVSDPSLPHKVGRIDSIGFASNVVITGTYAFVSTGADIRIIDVSQPGNPSPVGTYPAQINDIALQGHLMALAQDNQLLFLDITNPITPTAITYYAVPAHEIELDGDTAYVGQVGVETGPYGPYYYGILRILDITNLSSIVELYYSGAGYDDPRSVPIQLRDMKLMDGDLYGFDWGCTRPSSPCRFDFGSVDVSNPVSPTLSYTSLYSVYRRDYPLADFALDPQLITLALTEYLRIYDPETHAESGGYPALWVDAVSVENNTAVVAAHMSGLLTIDVADPISPALKDAYTTTAEFDSQPAMINTLAVYGPYVYAQIIASNFGLSRVDVLDISDSTAIARVSSINWTMIPKEIYHGYGYYFDKWIGTQLRGMNLDNPTNPVTTTGVATSISPKGLVFYDHYAYVPGDLQGLHIINLADPMHPTEVKRLAEPIPVYLADSQGSYLYFFSDQALLVYSLSDPENPMLVQSTPVADLTGGQQLVDMVVLDDTVYLLTSTSLRVFYLPQPTASAEEVAGFTRPASVFKDVDVTGNTVYIASGENGLLILQHLMNDPSLGEQVFLPLVSRQYQSQPAGCLITYRAHMQELGWRDWEADGATAGTPGQGLRMEALQVNLCAGLPPDMGLVLQPHVQAIGWMGWVYQGEIAGTTGQFRQMEAVRIQVLNAPLTNISYRVYNQDMGWSQWVSNGSVAGTTGQGKRLEAIQITLNPTP